MKTQYHSCVINCNVSDLLIVVSLSLEIFKLDYIGYTILSYTILSYTIQDTSKQACTASPNSRFDSIHDFGFTIQFSHNIFEKKN